MYVCRFRFSPSASTDIAVHETLVEVTPQQIVDKVLLLPTILCSSRLVLKHHIVIPPPLHAVILVLVQQRVSQRNVLLPLIFLPLSLVRSLFGSCFRALCFDLRKLSMQLRLFVFVATTIAITLFSQRPSPAILCF